MNDPDVIDQTVSWKEKENVELENDQPIHLRFVLKNTDLFSFKFIETAQEYTTSLIGFGRVLALPKSELVIGTNFCAF